MSKAKKKNRYRVDISAQFVNDVTKGTGWVNRAGEWLKDRDVDYASDNLSDTNHIIYFAHEDDAIMFRLLFGGV
jgi:hypothetical protein